VADGALGLRRDVDLALAQALDEVLGRQVDELDLVGALEDLVRQGLAHPDARDLRHHVVEAFEMLDVERGVDVDAGRQKFFDVLVALGVPAARRVGVCQLVDQEQLRPPGKCCIDVEFLEHPVAIFGLLARQDLETLGEPVGLGAAVGLDQADHDVDILAHAAVGGFEHGVGLADSGGGAQEHLEAAALLRRRLLQQRFGRGAFGAGVRLGHGAILRRPPRLRQWLGGVASVACGATVGLVGWLGKIFVSAMKIAMTRSTSSQPRLTADLLSLVPRGSEKSSIAVLFNGGLGTGGG